MNTLTKYTQNESPFHHARVLRLVHDNVFKFAKFLIIPMYQFFCKNSGA